MMNIIAIDVASEVSSYCVLKNNGRIQKEDRVVTQIGKIKSIIKAVPRPRQVVFEEGTQAAWLWSELHSICDDILVCNPRAVHKFLGQFKSDKNDARIIAQLARTGQLKRVWHGGKELQNLREAVSTYQVLNDENVRLKNRIRAVFRGNGILVKLKAYSADSRQELIKSLPLPAQRTRVLRLGKILDLVLVEKATALKEMIKYARKQNNYKLLRQIDSIGPVFASMFLAVVGDPFRFRTKQQLWSYAGLAVMTYESSEFEVQDGKIKRKNRATKTRGLVCSYNRTLKYLFKQAAVTLCRSAWKEQYAVLCKNSKNHNNAQLTIARKLACVMLHIAKTGEKYELDKVFKKH